MVDNLESMKHLSQEDCDKIFSQCMDELPEAMLEFNQNSLSYIDTIEEASRKLESEIENWIDLYLKNVSTHLKCITPLSVDSLAKDVITSIVGRKQELDAKFEQRLTSSARTTGVFNTEHIYNVRDILLPLVAEVKLLHYEVILISKQKYRLNQ